MFSKDTSEISSLICRRAYLSGAIQQENYVKAVPVGAGAVLSLSGFRVVNNSYFGQQIF